MEEGLPGTSVLAVLQTHDGYLWVGMPEGLARFDGVRFVLFRTSNTPAFLSHAVRCLYEDRAHTLWIGTDRGVVCERDGVFEHCGRDNVIVTAFAEDAAGTMWVGTYGNGLWACRAGQWERQAHVDQLGSRFVDCLFVDSADRLWVGFERHNGVVCRDAGGFRFFDGGGALRDRVQTIAEQPRGTLWLGTRDQGLFSLHGDTLHQFLPADGLANPQVYEVRAAQDGGLWVLAESLQHIDHPAKPSFSTITRGPDDHFIVSALDSEGSMWLGTPNDGLIRMRPRPYRLITVDSGPGRQVRSVTEDGAGNIWFVLQGHGLARMSPGGELATHLERLLPGSRPKAVYAAGDGTVWMIDEAAHAWRDGQWTTPGTSPGETYDVFEDRARTLWLTKTGAGIAHFVDGTFQTIGAHGRDRIPSTASSFTQAPDGTLYFGLWQAGLARVSGGQVTVFDRTRGLPGDEVRAVYADTNDRVWVGLKNHGLALIDHDVCLHSAVLSEALADNVRAILEDDNGRLWFGTSAGVMWANKDDLLTALRGERTASSVHIGSVDDGPHVSSIYSGRQPVAWKTHDHRLLFAGRDGVVVIDPAHLPVSPIAPPVHIERVLLDRHPASGRAGVTAPAGVRDLAIEYSAPSFVQPNRVLFKYRLEGYDHAWVDAGTRRTAFYSNLPPGRYVFRVRACNSNGVWNALGDQLAIVQEPHFYQRLWFYAAALASLLAVALGLHRWRTIELRRANEKLERGIAERTHQLELANEVILERTRELELANDAKSNFLESVSHEIRNPLGGLNGLLGMLQRENRDAATRDLARSIQACASTLNRAFEEVLGHARLEHGGFVPQLVTFSLRALLEELVASFAWQSGQQGNRIELRFAADFVDGFVGDAAAINTITANFISNAIKYAPGSPIELSVETHPREDQQLHVCIEVRDHGPGIPAEEQALIFRKFVRGSKARRDAVAGTGLGLATCRVMAQAISGHVGVESQVGDGASFHLWAPLRRSERPAATAAPALPGARIMVVDDERYNLLVLQDVANELGCHCDVADNGAEALRLAAAARFDIILLDWDLPDMNGGEVARRIRERPDGRHPVIIAITAHESSATRRACVENGMDAFLARPFTAAQLGAQIAAVLALRSGGNPPSPAAGNGAAPAGADEELNPMAFAAGARAKPGTTNANPAAYAAALDEAMARLEAAVAGDDVSAIAGAAHRLFGLSGLVGARTLSAATRELDHAARHGSREERAARFRTVVAAADAIKRRLRELTPDRDARA